MIRFLKREVKVEKTARYYVSGDVTPQIRRVILVTHGYGMSAERFIKKFDGLAGNDTAVIAPEGLYRFYLRGSGGRVGANWMTKEDRLRDIEDNVSYLDAVLTDAGVSGDTEIRCIGFSQGLHTLMRWAVRTPFRVSDITAWGSLLPDDIATEQYLDFLNARDLKIAWGRADEYINEKVIRDHLKFLDNLGVKYRFEPYDGTHRIEETTLMKLMNE